MTKPCGVIEKPYGQRQKPWGYAQISMTVGISGKELGTSILGFLDFNSRISGPNSDFELGRAIPSLSSRSFEHEFALKKLILEFLSSFSGNWA